MSNERRYPLLQRALEVDANGNIFIPGAVNTTTTAPAAGGAGALPATPFGYKQEVINGRVSKVPYY